MKKLTVGILFGGMSCEHEVSLSSATSILLNIDKEKYNPLPIGITKDGKWYLYSGDISKIKSGEWERDDNREVFISPIKNSPLYVMEKDGSLNEITLDAVFPALHGSFGEDGRLQGVLESAGIPFVGPGCLSSALCMDKGMTKLILKNYGIPQAKAVIVTKAEVCLGYEKIKEAVSLLGYPLFVKPSAAGSSVGVSKVTCESDLKDAVELALSVCDRVLIEEFIEGKEIEVAVMGDDKLTISECGEIAPGSEFYDYETKYSSDTAEYFIPARIDVSVSDKVRKYAEKIFRALDCKGLSRVDFFVNGDRIVFNEINTLPGFTNISMYPKLMMALGMSYSELITRLITLATKGK